MIHRKRWIIVLAGAALVPNVSLIAGQEAGSTPSSTSEDSKSRHIKHSHAHEFLIHGTVFDNHALALPGVELKIRRDGEKKYRWSTHCNRRGEFAIRVPQGAEYEVVAEVKGMATQTRSADAKEGAADGNLVFHMERSGGGKK